jgi:flagellar biosynthesis protein FlhG
MTKKASLEDYRVLDLSEDATADEVKRAYHRRRALYSEGSLATYSLMEDEQRAEMLHRIDMAYMHISKDLRQETSITNAMLPFYSAEQAAAPGPGERVGPYLRHRRESLGYTIHDVAQRSRIRSTYLELIENEQFKDLPAPVYLRGFLLEYARILGLPEAEKIARRFLDQAGLSEP